MDASTPDDMNWHHVARYTWKVRQIAVITGKNLRAVKLGVGDNFDLMK